MATSKGAPPIPEPIAVKADPQDSVPVELVGKKYMVRTPKSWLSMKMGLAANRAEEDPGAMMDVLEKWIAAAFGKANGKKVLARLDDTEDDLDLEHIMDLVEALSERSASNRPTS